jgi:hypothetical protein
MGILSEALSLLYARDAFSSALEAIGVCLLDDNGISGLLQNFLQTIHHSVWSVNVRFLLLYC